MVIVLFGNSHKNIRQAHNNHEGIKERKSHHIIMTSIIITTEDRRPLPPLFHWIIILIGPHYTD